MPLAKIGKLNYLVKVLLLLAAIFILALAVILLVNSYPDALGSPPPNYRVTKSYEFEPWSFLYHDLHLSFPQGGTIIPVYEQERQEAVIILSRETGPGDNNPDGIVCPAGIFLMINEDELERVKKDMIFIPVDEPGAFATVNNIFKKQMGLPLIWSDKIPLAFPPAKSTPYYYFTDRQGNPILPPVLGRVNGSVYLAGLIYILFFLITWLIILILSLDHRSSARWKGKQELLPDRWELGLLLPAGVLAFGGEILPGVTGLPEILVFTGYGATVLLLFILFRVGKIGPLDLGIRPDTFNRGYFIAVMAAIMLLTIVLKLPRGIRWSGWPTVAAFITTFFCLGLSREIIWRGLIQDTLGRQFSPLLGLLGTALLAGLIRAGFYGVVTPWMLSYPFTFVEIAVLETGLAAILGFLYLRTENILSCAFLHTLVIFLPQILVF